ncbi:Protein unc-13-like protein C [Frankliniella fusca]|uniref:Protein unc-13-like protein C n=1 Tax=Frankliniella fusca TaxID=407009 RepID=A0AAE1GTY9_9NEOP|nr:Protein unc-13-like protein C [Frankliniella fusca]
MGTKNKPIRLDDDQLSQLTSQITEALKAQLFQREEEVDKRLTGLDTKTDELEQHNRLENLRIFGVKEESGEDTDKIVINVALKAKIKLNAAAISRSHRVGPRAPGKTRAIIVKFVSYADRKRLFEAKKNLKGTGITIREDLTMIRQQILKKATDKFSMQCVWSNNGVIIVKHEDKYHRFKTMAQLDDFIYETL